MINWLHNNYGGFKAESILINCHYPVSQDSFVLQWGVIVEKPKGLDEETTDKLARVFTEGVSKGFLQDVEIWKHKTRIDNPLLVEEDGAVYQMRRWYQQFYVDVADVTPDMTDRFEIEVDTTAANEKWHVEVEENLRRQAEDRKAGREQPARDMATQDAPDVDRLARSMVVLHGGTMTTTTITASDGQAIGSWSKAPDFASDPDRAAAVREATAAGPGALSDRGTDAGRLPVLPRHRRRQEAGSRTHAVQWNSEAGRRCAYFAEVRASGGAAAAARSCPRLADSIKHAVAEGSSRKCPAPRPPATGAQLRGESPDRILREGGDLRLDRGPGAGIDAARKIQRLTIRASVRGCTTSPRVVCRACSLAEELQALERVLHLSVRP